MPPHNSVAFWVVNLILIVAWYINPEIIILLICIAEYLTKLIK